MQTTSEVADVIERAASKISAALNAMEAELRGSGVLAEISLRTIDVGTMEGPGQAWVVEASARMPVTGSRA